MTTKTMRVAGLVMGLMCSMAGVLGAGEMRTWTDTTGAKMEAEYVKSTETTVTVRNQKLQTMTIPLDKFSEADRQAVKELRAKELEASLVETKFKGELAWRLGTWRGNVQWQLKQAAELWTWDVEAKKPKEKLADIKVEYAMDDKKVGEFQGFFETKEALKLSKEDRVVVISHFNFKHNNEVKEFTDTSIPMLITEPKDGFVDLPTIRASAR